MSGLKNKAKTYEFGSPEVSLVCDGIVYGIDSKEMRGYLDTID